MDERVLVGDARAIYQATGPASTNELIAYEEYLLLLRVLLLA